MHQITYDIGPFYNYYRLVVGLLLLIIYKPWCWATISLANPYFLGFSSECSRCGLCCKRTKAGTFRSHETSYHLLPIRDKREARSLFFGSWEISSKDWRLNASYRYPTEQPQTILSMSFLRTYLIKSIFSPDRSHELSCLGSFKDSNPVLPEISYRLGFQKLLGH